MKKLIFIIALLFSYNSFAQDSVSTQPKNSKSFLGFDRVGVFASPEWAATYFIFNGSEGKMFPQYNFGVTTMKKLSKRWDLNLGLGYSSRKYQTESMSHGYQIFEDGIFVGNGVRNAVDTYTTREIIMPINFHLTYGQYDKSPLFYFLSMGTELGFVLNHKIDRDYENNEFPSISGSTASGTIEYKRLPLNFQRFNLNLGIGLGYEFKNKNALRVEPNLKLDIMDVFTSGVTILGNPVFSRGVRFTYTYSFRK
jgi:hypothetical protein